MRVGCVVVTYNRKEILVECLEAIINQSYKVDKIIIIDNNSQDGTELYLKEKGLLEIEEITNISSLTKLKKLNISNNPITKINGLKNLHELEEIYVIENKIKNIEVFEEAPKLRKICYIKKNKCIDEEFDRLKGEFAEIGFTSFEMDGMTIIFMKES